MGPISGAMKIPEPLSDVQSFEDTAIEEKNMNASIIRPRASSQARKDHSIIRGKIAAAVESYFKSRAFTAAEDQSILTTIRDFDICAHQQGLDEQMKALCFVNALRGQARQLFCENIDETITLGEMVHLMRIQYNYKAQLVRVQAEIDSLYLASFLQRAQNQIFEKRRPPHAMGKDAVDIDNIPAIHLSRPNYGLARCNSA